MRGKLTITVPPVTSHVIGYWLPPQQKYPPPPPPPPYTHTQKR